MFPNATYTLVVGDRVERNIEELTDYMEIKRPVDAQNNMHTGEIILFIPPDVEVSAEPRLAPSGLISRPITQLSSVVLGNIDTPFVDFLPVGWSASELDRNCYMGVDLCFKVNRN
jgi:hypothetical protein